MNSKTMTPNTMTVDITTYKAATLTSMRRWMNLRRLLAIALIILIGPTAPLLAQVAAVAGAQAATPMVLHIVILDGEDALNSIRERTAREPIVKVEDENHKPVAGALLLFTIQGGPDGAGASFNGLNTLSVTTDAEGKATAHGLLPNQVQGKYSIAVQATLGTLVATAIIKQANVPGAGSGGANTAPGSTSTSTTSGTTAEPSQEPVKTSSRSRRPYKLTHFLRRPWVIAGGVVIIGVVVGVAVANSGGSGATTITPGTGTVGP